MRTNVYGIILWKIETYFLNKKFTQSSGNSYQEVIDGTLAESCWARPKKYLPINLFNIHMRL